MKSSHHAGVIPQSRRHPITRCLFGGMLIMLLSIVFSSCAPLNPYQQQSGQTYARPEQVQLRETSRTLEEAQRLVRDLDLLRYEIDNLRHGF